MFVLVNSNAFAVCLSVNVSTLFSDRALIPWAEAGAEYIVETSSEVIDHEKAYAHIKVCSFLFFS